MTAIGTDDDDDIVKDAVKKLQDEKAAYENDVHNVAFRNKLGEAYEKIHSFGSALEEFKEFGTDQDYKAVVTSGRAAADAYSELLQLEDEMPSNEDLENESLYSKLGATIDENCTTLDGFNDAINGLKSRYEEAVDEATELDEDMNEAFQYLE